jgi:hypothetical protein
LVLRQDARPQAWNPPERLLMSWNLSPASSYLQFSGDRGHRPLSSPQSR